MTNSKIDLSIADIRLEDVKGFANVGFFMSTWAVVKSSINNAIMSALGLKPPIGVIVTANIMMATKVNMLKTFVHEARLSDEDKAKYMNVISRVEKISQQRNIIAHNLFMIVSKEGAVHFGKTKARGKVEQDIVEFTPEKFLTLNRKMLELYDDLECLALDLEKEYKPLKQ